MRLWLVVTGAILLTAGIGTGIFGALAWDAATTCADSFQCRNSARSELSQTGDMGAVAAVAGGSLGVIGLVVLIAGFVAQRPVAAVPNELPTAPVAPRGGDSSRVLTPRLTGAQGLEAAIFGARWRTEAPFLMQALLIGAVVLGVIGLFAVIDGDGVAVVSFALAAVVVLRAARSASPLPGSE